MKNRNLSLELLLSNKRIVSHFIKEANGNIFKNEKGYQGDNPYSLSTSFKKIQDLCNTYNDELDRRKRGRIRKHIIRLIICDAIGVLSNAHRRMDLVIESYEKGKGC